MLIKCCLKRCVLLDYVDVFLQRKTLSTITSHPIAVELSSLNHQQLPVLNCRFNLDTPVPAQLRHSSSRNHFLSIKELTQTNIFHISVNKSCSASILLLGNSCTCTLSYIFLIRSACTGMFPARCVQVYTGITINIRIPRRYNMITVETKVVVLYL